MALGFHGGYPGLEAGDEVLPPSVSGFTRALYLHCTDAFITPDFDYSLRRAVDFVGTSPSGPRREAARVYEVVIPAGIRCPESWKGAIRVPRATITRVLLTLTWDGSVHHVADLDPEFAAATHERLQDYSRIKA